ncbi:MAG: homoserine dehydrogenase [Bacteroidales bacterium]|jgi:homoserine dehydrogenase|nr:homoserine dehydrogenase [Bacteroidales bacterium]
MSKKQYIGLFGLGTVGSGLFHVLETGKTVNAEIKKVCVKDPDKKRTIEYEMITYLPDEILDDSNINLIVELINDSDAAFDIVKQALLKDKNVVTGNKKMLAFHLPELLNISNKNNKTLLYEASACGSIPIIRNLEEYYDNDLLTSITGILNGSSNYILTKIFQDNLSYTEALKHAQDLGFAESDPISDVEGFDSLYKLIIITLHSMGAYLHPKKAFNYGISKICREDLKYAREKRAKFKLVGQVIKLDHETFTLFVIPRLVYPPEYLYNVDYEYNGIIIEGACYDKQFMSGKGAGAYPTGSAVLSDITALMHDYRYEFKKKKFFTPLTYSDNISLEIYLRYDSNRDFQLFNFESVSETYCSSGLNYVIGFIRLSELSKMKDSLSQLNIFMASTGKFNYQ